MKKYRKSFLHEVARFDRCNRQTGSPFPNDIGLRQFYDYESRGIRPDAPDPYYVHLLNGKKWWEWTVNEYAGLFTTNDWPGWCILEQDFADDPAGLEQIRQRIAA